MCLVLLCCCDTLSDSLRGEAGRQGRSVNVQKARAVASCAERAWVFGARPAARLHHHSTLQSSNLRLFVQACYQVLGRTELSGAPSRAQPSKERPPALHSGAVAVEHRSVDRDWKEGTRVRLDKVKVLRGVQPLIGCAPCAPRTHSGSPRHSSFRQPVMRDVLQRSGGAPRCT